MALINCPECGKQVSDKAMACPNCGVGIASAAESRGSGTTVTTVQETSKKLKLHTLGSVILILFGVIWVIAATSAVEHGGDPGIGVSLAPFLIFAGFVWFIATRIRIWWHHK